MKSYAVLVLSILVTVVPVSVSQTSPAAMIGHDRLSEYSPSGGISITGNDDFANQASSWGWPGNGSLSNPYVIENLSIESSQVGISISQVSVSFVIRDCVIRTHYYSNPSVCLSETSGGIIEHCLINSGGFGVFLSLVNDCAVDRNTIVASPCGIFVSDCCNCTLTNNVLTNGGMQLAAEREIGYRHVVANNTVFGRQFGYFWNVSDIYVDASSFGQLVVVRGQNLILRNGAFAGSPFGLLLVACTNCTSMDMTVDSTEFGIRVQSCDRVTLLSSSVLNNGVCGLNFHMSNNCIIQENEIGGNNGGINAVGCINMTMLNNSIQRNQGGISVWSAEPSLGVFSVSASSIVGNTISENSGCGISLGTEVHGFRVYDNVFVANGIANARDDGYGNRWDDGAGLGNFWDDYSGSGYYEIQGYARGVDHYPNGIRVDANSTTPVNGTLRASEFQLAVWFFLSVAIISIPMFLVIRSKRS